MASYWRTIGMNFAQYMQAYVPFLDNFFPLSGILSYCSELAHVRSIGIHFTSPSAWSSSSLVQTLLLANVSNHNLQQNTAFVKHSTTTTTSGKTNKRFPPNYTPPLSKKIKLNGPVFSNYNAIQCNVIQPGF